MGPNGLIDQQLQNNGVAVDPPVITDRVSSAGGEMRLMAFPDQRVMGRSSQYLQSDDTNTSSAVRFYRGIKLRREGIIIPSFQNFLMTSLNLSNKKYINNVPSLTVPN